MQSGIPAVAVAGAEVAAPGILGFFLGRWSEQFFGNSYSKLSRTQLTNLINLYNKSFKTTEYPLLWKLDSKNRPEKFFHGDDFRFYIECNFRNPGRRNYLHQSKMIRENIIAYLNQRKKRWVAKGNPGDLLEQFLGEWLEWSTNNLPFMGYDTAALETLQKRLDYIINVINDPFILPYGRINRANNKYICFNLIRDNLQACQRLAQQEKIRVSATEKFEDLRTNMAALLQDSLNIVYYNRRAPVASKPFDIPVFANTTDHPIKASHSGRMLNETIHKAGLAAFILSREKLEEKCENRYFDENKSAILIDWLDRKTNLTPDLPAWVITNKDIQQSLQHLQNLCVAILRYTEIKNLIEVARDLSSHSGNVWAYADETGKHAIVALEFLHKAALKELIDTTQQLINQQNELRSTYIQKQRKKDEGAENYLKLIETHDKVKECEKHLTTTMNDVRVQLDEFPIESEAQINELKQIFYTSINSTFSRAHPEKANEFLLDIPKAQSNTTAAEKAEATLFDFPLIDINQNKVRYETPELQNFSFTKPAPEIDVTWQLGGSYETWTRDFFINNMNFFAKYAELVKNFQAALPTGNLDEITNCFQALNLSMENFATKINNESPKWRLSPLTLGFPFNTKARHFTKLILAEIAMKRTYLQQCAQQTVQPMPAEPLSGTTDKLNSAQLLSSLQMLSTNAEKLEQRTKQSQELLQPSNADTTYVSAPDPFHLWWEKVDENFTAWIDSHYVKSLTIFIDSKSTQTILTSLLQYRDGLNNDDSLKFTKRLAEIHHNKTLLYSISLKLANKKNPPHILLVLKLLEIVITTPGSQERADKSSYFNSVLREVFPQTSKNSRLFSSPPAQISVAPTTPTTAYRPGG